MMHLLLGQALANGEPADTALRALPTEAARQALSAANAGHLAQALELAGIPTDLAELTQRWPAALHPALERLTRIPRPAVFQAPLLHEAGYLLLVASVQLLAVLLLHAKVLPVVTELPTAGLSPSSPMLLAVVLGDLLFMVLVACVAGWAVSGMSRASSLVGWGRYLSRAREASLAAALRDSEAPTQLQNSFVLSCAALRGTGLTDQDLSLVIQRSLVEATAAQQRFLTAVRLAGYGVLVGLALAVLAGVYGTIASMGGLI